MPSSTDCTPTDPDQPVTSTSWRATTDGASILFELRGRTVFEGDAPGRQNLVGWLESDHESYSWLNDVVCIAEGRIDAEAFRAWGHVWPRDEGAAL